MAGDWIKMRSGLESNGKVIRMASALDRAPAAVAFDLYRLAGWFAEHGKYGKLKSSAAIVDMFLGSYGFVEQMRLVGWLADHDGTLTLREFCDVSTWRKSLGAKVRSQVLSAGACAACGSTGKLEIDHKVPIVRGGSCEASNLQALCVECNRRKGRKTMEEFVA